MNRRNFLGTLAASFTVSACSGNTTMRSLSTAIDNSFGGATAFDSSYPDKLPYASIAVRLPGIRRALLVLGRVDGNQLHWISADRVVLVTRYGRLIKTVGFSENLQQTDFIDHDFLEPKKHSNPHLAAPRIIDLNPGHRYGLKVESLCERKGQEVITLGNRSHQTERIEEHCTVKSANWKFTNTYWLDEQGFAWRSIQHYAPSLPPAEIDVTKPHFQA